MGSSEKFINFPLIVLAYGTSEKERLETLMQWAIIDVGRITLKYWQKRISAATPAQAVNHFWRSAKQRQTDTKDPIWQAYARLGKVMEEHGIADTDIDGYVWALGAETLGLSPKWRDAETCLEAHERLESFFDQMTKQTARTGKELCWVRGMKADWLLAAHRMTSNQSGGSGEQLSYSHWAVLTAVLSKIGSNKPPCKTVTWPEIQRRALGYSSESEMKAAMAFRQDGLRPLSRDKIDSRTQQLALSGFFVRHVPKIGRKSLPAWYGAGIDMPGLVKIAEAAKAKRKGGWQARWRQQQAGQTALVQKVIDFEQAAQVSQTAAPRAFPVIRQGAV